MSDVSNNGQSAGNPRFGLYNIIMQGNPTPDPVNLNEDWLKVGYWDMPTNFDSFMNIMAPWADDKASQIAFLKDIMMLPCWYAAPAGIKKRAAELIGGR